ncbi:hypothetical protein D3C71_1293740 [compost metagenome]
MRARDESPTNVPVPRQLDSEIELLKLCGKWYGLISGKYEKIALFHTYGRRTWDESAIQPPRVPYPKKNAISSGCKSTYLRRRRTAGPLLANEGVQTEGRDYAVRG